MAEQMTCDQVEEVLALASLDALDTGDEAASARRHLAGCAQCRRTAASFSSAVSLLPDALPLVAPPPRLRHAVMARVYADAIEAPPPKKPLLRRWWEAVPSARAFTMVSAAAVVAALVLGLWGAFRPTSPGPAPARSVAYQLSGTTAEPTATGTLQFDPQSKRGVIVVHGLQAPDLTPEEHHVYEVWLIPSKGAPVPAGFLTLQPDHQTWTGVVSGDVTTYRTVAATIEPDGGTLAPTGLEVLSGNVG
jgi:anti-sigma-K factor RskA